ncbi:MAG TPA: hypothetical protein VGF82_20250 [Terracidiphilus sp.]|jgi:hypothetical protein
MAAILRNIEIGTSAGSFELEVSAGAMSGAENAVAVPTIAENYCEIGQLSSVDGRIRYREEQKLFSGARIDPHWAHVALRVSSV